MSVNILTPTNIWGNFYTEVPVKAKTAVQKTIDGVMLSYVKIAGREVNGERVEVMALLSKKENFKGGPAILVSSNPELPISEELAIKFAKEGYLVLSVDLGGQNEESKLYTVYPKSISYANFVESKYNLLGVNGSVKNTCWYEWGAVLFYAYEYLREQCGKSRIGVVGVKHGANAAWCLAANKQEISACVFLNNAGWLAYKGVFKYANTLEPDFSDEACAFIAGIDSQAYANHVKSPTLILSALLDSEFDPDRADDTIARISKDVYSCIDFTLSYESGISQSAYNNMLVFLNNFLRTTRKTFIKEPKISATVKNGEIVISTEFDGKNVKDVVVYLSEEIDNPFERTFESAKKVCIKEKEATFTFKPYAYSKSVLIFAKAFYENGFSISSNLLSKKINAEDFMPSNKSKIIFSTREENSESIFSVSNNLDIDFLASYAPVIKKGPMDIMGAYSSHKLTTKKVLTSKNTPSEDAMLILDFYSKEHTILNVTLSVKTEFGITDYTAYYKSNGGNVWCSVRLGMEKFKTAEGRILKSYENLYSLSFSAEGEYLVNNILWV